MDKIIRLKKCAETDLYLDQTVDKLKKELRLTLADALNYLRWFDVLIRHKALYCWVDDNAHFVFSLQRMGDRYEAIAHLFYVEPAYRHKLSPVALIVLCEYAVATVAQQENLRLPTHYLFCGREGWWKFAKEQNYVKSGRFCPITRCELFYRDPFAANNQSGHVYKWQEHQTAEPDTIAA